MGYLADVGKQYYELDQDIRNLNAQLELKKSERELKRQELIQAMQEQDLPEFALEDVNKRFSIVEDCSSSYLKENQEAVFDVLRRLGYDGIIKETVHDKTFNSLIKEITENGEKELPEELQPYIKIYKYKKISITKR